jgi:hypothetical protein
MPNLVLELKMASCSHLNNVPTAKNRIELQIKKKRRAKKSTEKVQKRLK